ncbi:MAG: hypothetical protein WBA97_16145 [Actinophytocola sp.]|uniref:hypothetical protein n=1 Tax=Actinophytocola sp. TaxID=1872138 RepID=UPI003C77AC39
MTTGRRHARAGSVTVTELLVRQAPPARCTDSSPAEPDDITDTIPVIGPASHRRLPARGAQFAKLATIGVAGVVLCGAVTVSSMIADQRREHVRSSTRPAAQITGEQALLPDRMDGELPRAPAPAPQPNLPPVTAAAPAPSTVPSTSQSASPPPSATSPSAEHVGDTSASAGVGNAEVGPANELELVREFYENLPDAPEDAFALLSPGLLHSSLGEFLQSWSKVIAIDSVDVVQHVDGVVATVRMRLLGGGHLRIQQLLTVAKSPLRIVGAQLLSAQRN